MGLTEIFREMEAVHRAKNQLLRVRLSKASYAMLTPYNPPKINMDRKIQ